MGFRGEALASHRLGRAGVHHLAHARRRARLADRRRQPAGQPRLGPARHHRGRAPAVRRGAGAPVPALGSHRIRALRGRDGTHRAGASAHRVPPVPPRPRAAPMAARRSAAAHPRRAGRGVRRARPAAVACRRHGEPGRHDHPPDRGPRAPTGNTCTSTAVSCATARSATRCAPPTPTCCMATASRPMCCSWTSIPPRWTSTSIPPSMSALPRQQRRAPLRLARGRPDAGADRRRVRRHAASP